MSQKGSTIKDIAKKTGLKEQIVRSYIWRKQNAEKYKALLERYFAKRKKNLTKKPEETGKNEAR
jgi:hypothetical protein